MVDFWVKDDTLKIKYERKDELERILDSIRHVGCRELINKGFTFPSESGERLYLCRCGFIKVTHNRDKKLLEITGLLSLDCKYERDKR